MPEIEESQIWAAAQKGYSRVHTAENDIAEDPAEGFEKTVVDAFREFVLKAGDTTRVLEATEQLVKTIVNDIGMLPSKKVLSIRAGSWTFAGHEVAVLMKAAGYMVEKDIPELGVRKLNEIIPTSEIPTQNRAIVEMCVIGTLRTMDKVLRGAAATSVRLDQTLGS